MLMATLYPLLKTRIGDCTAVAVLVVRLEIVVAIAIVTLNIAISRAIGYPCWQKVIFFYYLTLHYQYYQLITGLCCY